LFAIASTLVALPLASAHDPPWTIPTYAYIEVNPNPVGVGQTVALAGWIDKVPPGSIGSWGINWHDMKFTITDPDGHVEELGGFDSDAVGGAWTSYIPEQPGTYEIVFSFPGQVAVEENPYPYGTPQGTAFYNDTYLATNQLSRHSASNRILGTTNKLHEQRMVLNRRRLAWTCSYHLWSQWPVF